MRERGLRADIVDAAIAASGDEPARCMQVMRALQESVTSSNWIALLTAYARCKRIARK